ncbi:MAG: glycosyltransferase family 4 protein [Ignavibacteriaceae bacterium]|nr:glycosyltransferase family 4 protein [Ignavibacteriaceae bacterium]
MKKVLFLTYYWPPSGKASLHFPLHLIKHLNELGWQSTVATVAEETFTQKDDSLLAEIPLDIKVHKIKSFEPFDLYRKFIGKSETEPLISSETISKERKNLSHRISIWIRMNLFIPDARIGWYPFAVKFLKKLLRHEKFDAIITVGPPHSTHLIGLRLSKLFHLPHVPIFIDPWVDIVYYKDFRRSTLTLEIDKYFEKSVLKNASHVIFVTKSTRADFVEKYPFVLNKSAVLYWGYNEGNFSKIPHMNKFSDEKILLHAGNIFDFQNPKRLWEYLQKILLKGERIKLQFVGTVSPEVRESLIKNGLEKVTEFLGFLPYQEVIQKLCAADFLLVCTTEKRHVPGKLFEYLRSQKPILCFGDENPEVEELIKNGNAGMFLSYQNSGEEFFKNVRSYSTDLSFVKGFERKKAASKLVEILNSLGG